MILLAVLCFENRQRPRVRDGYTKLGTRGHARAPSSNEGFDRQQLDDADIWAAELEHHFALIAARHLVRALELEPVARTAVAPMMRTELIEGRDLHEHWGREPGGVRRDTAARAAALPVGS